MVGFVNALAILIFTSQFPALIGVPWLVYPLVAVGLLIMFLLPKLTTIVPAPLVAIVLLTVATVVFALNVPKSETTVMLATVVVTVATHNLAYGVVVGVVTAMVLFARRVAHLTDVTKVSEADTDNDGLVDTRVYLVTGELFFASSNDLVYQFDYIDDPKNVIIDLSGAHIWDASTVATLDAITTKYASKGKHAEIIGLDAASAERHVRLSGKLGDGH